MNYIILVIFCSALLIFVGWVITYYSEKKGEQQLPFRSFKTLYEIAPEKWDVRFEDHPRYKKNSYELYHISIYMSTFYGYLCYRRFSKTIERNEKRKEMNADMKRLVQCWQEDICRYKENAEKEVQNLVRCITEHKG